MDYLTSGLLSAVLETMLNREVNAGNGNGISLFHTVFFFDLRDFIKHYYFVKKFCSDYNMSLFTFIYNSVIWGLKNY